MSDTAERVKKIVVEHLNVDADKVTDTASFIEDLG
ncbi:MAG TPA: acyl carrier protein, partial [Rhizomicrobium sp.]|nr:acyl carrier protein [Rhizomicrobium sp.]